LFPLSAYSFSHGLAIDHADRKIAQPANIISSKARRYNASMEPDNAYLTDKARFLEVAEYFVDRTVEETAHELPAFEGESLMRLGLSTLAKDNAEIVFALSESPIETIFMNSLALLMIKNAIPLVIQPQVPDAPAFTKDMRAQLRKLKEFVTWYEARHDNWSGISTYIEDQVARGIMPSEERSGLLKWILYYDWLHYRDCLHVIMQAGLPQIKVNGKGIRVDLYFWIPSNENCNMVVECDGFLYHGDRQTFTKDRQRDRALTAAGLQCVRYSGSEITNDPVASSSNLFDLIEHWLKFD